MKKILPILLTILLNISTSAQNVVENSKENDIKLLKIIQNKNNIFENRIEKKVYNEHFKTIEHKIERNYAKEHFILDNDYRSFIKNIFSNLQKANPTISANSPNFYILKSNTPNALNLGYDYYMINNGLFELFDNEYQLAAVISHEIAHNHLAHVKQEIIREAEFIQDFKKEYRSLKRSELIKLIKSQDEVIQLKYDIANQNRKKEIAADSLGFILYANLNYPKSEYLKSLEKLKEYDKNQLKKIDDSTYYKTLEVSDIKLNSKWLKLEKNEFFSGLSFTEHLDKDSVSTHPNVEDRIKWISEKFKINTNESSTVQASQKYTELKEKTSKNFYENFFNNDEYGLALYHLIYEKQINPKAIYLDKNLETVFEKLHDARVSLKFNKYIPIADPNATDEDYNKFLHLIWNIPTTDIKTIADYYKTKATL